MSEAWRCFVAVPLDEALRSALAGAVAGLRAGHQELDAGWRWSQPDQWHITLAFLGATSPASRNQLEDALRRVATGCHAFWLPTGGLGVFPTPRAARVLWYGVDDPEGRLRQLAEELRREISPDAPASFHPHVTLGRARHRHGSPVADLLRSARMPAGRLRVDQAVLFRSHLGGGPARYEALAVTPLASAGGSAAP